MVLATKECVIVIVGGRAQTAPHKLVPINAQVMDRATMAHAHAAPTTTAPIAQSTASRPPTVYALLQGHFLVFHLLLHLLTVKSPRTKDHLQIT